MGKKHERRCNVQGNARKWAAREKCKRNHRDTEG